ncbi:MAG: 2-polyprenylphenol 6-hydroxylase [Pseudomonadota bacterium]
MSVLTNIVRLVRTGATFERTGAMDIALEAMEAPPALRFAARVVGLPFRWLGLRGDPALPPVVRALTALGPAYIKFGQLLSTRPDVAGEELARQLRVLQDRLPPFPEGEARELIARELGAPVDALFTSFSAPVAAASIAQVHKATLAESGAEVAVKVLRPGIARAFRRDIDAFFFVARAIEWLAPAARRLKPTEVVHHFASVVRGELDFRMEAAAAAEFAANATEDPGFRVPGVLWPLSSQRVLTTEWVNGINLGEIEALHEAGVDFRATGALIIQTFLNHALRDGFFHGDMHQGNLKIGPDGALIAFDFGIMGRIDAYTRRVYAEILYGFLRQNYRRVAEVHFEAGYVPADRDVDEFAQALRAIGAPIFGQDASRISMGRLLAHLFDVTERFGMETRTELLLLQRTMVVVEGVSRSLDPNINMWEVAQPIVGRYIRDNIGPAATLRDLARTVGVLSRFGPRLPHLAEAALMRATQEPVQEPSRRREQLILWALMGVVAGIGVVAGAALAALGLWLLSVFIPPV